MKNVFLLMSLIAILLMGIALVLGACAPVRQTPVASMPKSTVFITSDLTIVPEAISIGDISTIGVTVTNTGEQTGTYTVVLKVNDDIAEMKDVTLAGRASQRVTFIFKTFSEGTHVVTIDQLKGVLEVRVGI